MAEKEERLSVIVYDKDPCENCPGNPMTDCQVCEKDLRYDGGMTRQEAIEKMAKAVYDTFSGCAHITPFEQVENKYKQGYYKRAEAALNALLEKGEGK